MKYSLNISFEFKRGNLKEQTMKTHIVVAFFILTVSSSAYANRCPADDMGCTKDNYQQKYEERIKQGKQEVKDANNMGERVKAVKSTARDCADCGLKIMSDSIDGGSEGGGAVER